MKVKELKTDKTPFDDVCSHRKTFEIRKDDRNFCKGDLLLLRETVHTGQQMAAGLPLEYTSRWVLVRVSHKVTGYGLREDWCVLSIRMVDVFDNMM